MCTAKQQPKECEKGKDPKACTPEQIRECHGDAKSHECEEQQPVDCESK
jgi:hypothetical protein